MSQTKPSTEVLTERIVDEARQLGFVGVGFSPIDPLTRGVKALKDWLDAGCHGEMAYMAQHGDRVDPTQLLNEARSLIAVALPYGSNAKRPLSIDSQPRGVIAQYAQGNDYHSVLRNKLVSLADACSRLVGRPVMVRPCVDSAPLLEREYAEQSGIGFIAKSTMLLMPGVGTYVLLGELLLDVDLQPQQTTSPKCGDCTSCLDACPTGAFIRPYVLDARRCISYLTIENKGIIPREFRPQMGQMIFGCDICQEACPFNASRHRPTAGPELTAKNQFKSPLLTDLLTMTSSGYRRFVKGTALRRASRAQLARNAAIALGNARDPSTEPVLINTLQNSIYPLVRAHTAWALGRFRSQSAKWALCMAQRDDPDQHVRIEAEAALDERDNP